MCPSPLASSSLAKSINNCWYLPDRNWSVPCLLLAETHKTWRTLSFTMGSLLFPKTEKNYGVSKQEHLDSPLLCTSVQTPLPKPHQQAPHLQLSGWKSCFKFSRLCSLFSWMWRQILKETIKRPLKNEGTFLATLWRLLMGNNWKPDYSWRC